MKKYNISLVILAYTEFQNIWNLLNYFTEEKMEFNNIIIIADKLEGIDAVNSLNCYKYKSKIWSLNNIKAINKSFHGGVIGTTNYIDDLPFQDDEKVVILEDDLFAKKEFFDQCERFFTMDKPIFVGYSKGNGTDVFFETFNILHMWGFALKFKKLKEIIQFHNRLRQYSINEKKQVINNALKFRYSCNVFEKYKSKLMNTIEWCFLNQTKESVDLYFMFYFLQNNLPIIKPSKSYIISFKENDFYEKELSDVEMDIKNTIHSFKV